MRDTEVDGSHSGVREWEVDQDRAERSAAETVDSAATSPGTIRGVTRFWQKAKNLRGLPSKISCL